MKKTWMILFALMLASCDQKIDGSNPDVAQKSLEKMGEVLSATDRAQLDNALIIIGEGISAEFIAANKGSGSEHELNLRQAVAGKINGKSYKEIVVMAEGYLQEFIQIKTLLLTKDIESLTAKKQQADIQAARTNAIQYELTKMDLDKSGRLYIYYDMKNTSSKAVQDYSLSIYWSSLKNTNDGKGCSTGFDNTLNANAVIHRQCGGYNFEDLKQDMPSVNWMSIKFPLNNKRDIESYFTFAISLERVQFADEDAFTPQAFSEQEQQELVRLTGDLAKWKSQRSSMAAFAMGDLEALVRGPVTVKVTSGQ